MLFGVGYNIYTSGYFFADVGIFYNLMTDANDYSGSTYDVRPGGEWRASKLELVSSPGFELGLGYGFGNMTLRTDLTFIINPIELEGEFYNLNTTTNIYSPSGTFEDSDDIAVFLTVGLTYWF